MRATLLSLGGAAGLGLITLGTTAEPVPFPGPTEDQDEPAHQRRASLVQRERVAPSGGAGASAAVLRDAPVLPVFPDDLRPIDGYKAHPTDDTWGMAGAHMLRLVPAAYDDGASSPADDGRPNPRAISNAICDQAESILNSKRASSMLWQWGQFLDHDLVETTIDSTLAYDIPVPKGDDWFDPGKTGLVSMGFDRSAGDLVEGVRQQPNNITAYIDGSAVYGSDADRAEALRTMLGDGKLKTSAGDLMPFNTEGLHNAADDDDQSLFLAGDIRSNEQVALTAIHTLFVREHNHQAERIAAARNDGPPMTGDEIYEHARAIVAALVQAITYNEFLPLLLGPDCLPPYAGFDPDANPGVSNVFATAGYRVGHTMLNPRLLRSDADGEESDEKHIALADAFFTPSEITAHGIDSLLRGLTLQRAQEIDNLIVDDVRNFLFGPPGAGGFDLASLNLQRGRDHGLGTYNDVRAAFGLLRVTKFTEINFNVEVAQALASVYPNVDAIDAWAGLLAEPHVPGGMVGPTLKLVLVDQFRRSRDGDPFFYKRYLPPEMVDYVDGRTLSVIMRDNTDIGGEIPDDAFRTPYCAGDVDKDGRVGFFDIIKYLYAFQAGEEWCDLNFDTILDFADVLLFIDMMTEPCL